MTIVRAAENEIESCVDIVFASELGRLYYPRREMLRREVEKGMRTDSILVAKAGG